MLETRVANEAFNPDDDPVLGSRPPNRSHRMLRCIASRFSILLLATLPAHAAERLVGRAHVLDGDTIVVAGIHVRLKGVAAPEVAHAGEAGEPGGDEARAFMTALIEGQTVVCNLTRERTHGRRVGYCTLDGQDIAAELIKAGLARDCPRFSAGRYAELETAAAASLPFPRYCRTR